MTPTTTVLDPLKHVTQNWAWFSESTTLPGVLLSVGHDHWLRAMLGYGTVSGLRVFTENDAKVACSVEAGTG